MNVMLVTKEKSMSSPLRDSKSVRWIQTPSVQIARSSKRIFVLSPATKLPEYSEFLREAIRCKNLCALFVYEDINSEWLPQMLTRAQIRPLKHMFVHKEFSLPKRIIAAWISNLQSQTIADATVFNDRLLVISCSLKEYEVPFDSIFALKRLPVEERSQFSISSDGSYIHWPNSDVHLDLDAFQYATDVIYRKKMDIARLSRSKNYGEAIAKLRKSHGLRQSDIAGISERQVRRIEHGGLVTSKVVDALASAHKMDANDYLDQLANMLY
jgi:hypothetical protein